MKELFYKTGIAYDSDTFTWEEIYFFMYDGKIYDSSTFQSDDSYEISSGYWDEIQVENSRNLGLFAEDEVEETVHRLVCDEAVKLSTEEFNASVAKAIRTVAQYNELKISGYVKD